jgi:hypothetical protein
MFSLQGNTNLRNAMLATLCFLTANILLVQIFVKNNYSPFIDPFTEALDYNSAVNHMNLGLFYDAGLPVISNNFLSEAFKTRGVFLSDEKYHPYLHCPEADAFIVSIGVRIFGKQDLRYLRIIPALINSALMCIFFTGTLKVITDFRARCWFFAAFTFVPLGWWALHGMPAHAYAHYIVLALIGLLLPALSEISVRPTRGAYAGACAMGFFSGLFLFDYAFIIIMAPAAVAALYHGGNFFTQSSLRRSVFLLSIIIGVGFTFAHILHLLQIAAYYGSVQKAFFELAHVAIYRAKGDVSYYQFVSGFTDDDCFKGTYCATIAKLGPVTGRFKLIFDYFFHFSAVNDVHKPVLVLPSILYIVAAGFYTLLIRGPANNPYEPTKRFLTMVSITVIACMLWLVVMTNHASVHIHLLPQHFYFIYILIVLFIAENMNRRSIQIRPDDKKAAR